MLMILLVRVSCLLLQLGLGLLLGFELQYSRVIQRSSKGVEKVIHRHISGRTAERAAL